MERATPVGLYWLTLLVAVALGGLLAAAPYVVSDASPLWLQLYASDGALRNTTLASVAGLLATAVIFFRATPLRFGRVRRPDGSVPEVHDVAGA